MKLTHAAFPSLLAVAFAACGGGSKKTTTPPVTTEAPDEEPDDLEPVAEDPPPPPPPLEWSAQADLAPVKGIKMKAAAVSFHQVEGQGVQVTSGALTGLTPGVYHVVVHESADCGKNASRIGGVWEPAAAVSLTVKVAKGETPALDDEVDFTLDGEDSIVGRTLALHADKKGKPGKAVACGAIVATGDAPDDDEE